jgi:hypothetical protein
MQADWERGRAHVVAYRVFQVGGGHQHRAGCQDTIAIRGRDPCTDTRMDPQVVGIDDETRREPAAGQACH